jgi:glycosyltransferase involved in cell wall biosynthesis
MRILFLLHAHPDLQAGGTEIFARDLFRELRRDKAIDGLFLAGTAPHQRPQSPGTPFQVVGAAADELLVWSGGFDPFYMSQIDLHGVSNPLADLLAELQPDVVHIHHLMTLGVEMVGLVRRVLPHAAIVMTLHDYYAICPNDGQMVTTAGELCHAASMDACRRCFPERGMSDFRLRDIHIGGALSMVDHFIAPSRFLRDRYVAWGLEPDRISVLPNGLPAMPQAPLRAAPDKRRDRFAFFGHINRFKGATVALGASARLSRAGVAHSLSLRGGADHQAPETIARFDKAREAAPDARYGGPYRRGDMPGLMAGADWVVFPSEWWENAPLVINEAFLHRRPVLCSAIGGAAELVQDGVNGLHFPVGDDAALAAAMRRAIKEPGLWQRLVNGIAPPVTIAESAVRHRALYAQLMSHATARQEAA